jgi:hypothetical protein
MADAVKQAIETRDSSTLRKMAITAMSDQKLVLQLLADLIECKPQQPGTGTARSA